MLSTPLIKWVRGAVASTLLCSLISSLFIRYNFPTVYFGRTAVCVFVEYGAIGATVLDGTQPPHLAGLDAPYFSAAGFHPTPVWSELTLLPAWFRGPTPQHVVVYVPLWMPIAVFAPTATFTAVRLPLLPARRNRTTTSRDVRHSSSVERRRLDRLRHMLWVSVAFAAFTAATHGVRAGYHIPSGIHALGVYIGGGRLLFERLPRDLWLAGGGTPDGVSLVWEIRTEIAPRVTTRINRKDHLHAVLPLWPLAFGSILVCRQLRSRARAECTHHCRRCEFSRAGLPAGSPCPECGAEQTDFAFE